MDETQTLVDTAQQVTSKVPETQTQQGISKVKAEYFWMGFMASSLLINVACHFFKATPKQITEQSSEMMNAACLFLKATPKQITE